MGAKPWMATGSTLNTRVANWLAEKGQLVKGDAGMEHCYAPSDEIRTPIAENADAERKITDESPHDQLLDRMGGERSASETTSCSSSCRGSHATGCFNERSPPPSCLNRCTSATSIPAIFFHS
jgi:hypothetical protein